MRTDSKRVSEQLDEHGFALVSGKLSESAIQMFTERLDLQQASAGESTVTTDVTTGISPRLDELGHELYGLLAPIANHWMDRMGFETWYAADFDSFVRLNSRGHQHPLCARLSRIPEGQGRGLSQEINGSLAFPLQVVTLLNGRPKSFSGGDLVLQQQRLDGSSVERAVPLNRGELIVVPVWRQLRTNPDRSTTRLHVTCTIQAVSQGVRDGAELLFHALR